MYPMQKSCRGSRRRRCAVRVRVRCARLPRFDRRRFVCEELPKQTAAAAEKLRMAAEKLQSTAESLRNPVLLRAAYSTSYLLSSVVFLQRLLSQCVAVLLTASLFIDCR